MNPLESALDHLSDEPHYVYEAWMRDVPVYVGMTCDIGRRLREHRMQQPWWRVVTEFRVAVHPSRRDAELAEGKRIAELLPANNRYLRGGAA